MESGRKLGVALVGLGSYSEGQLGPALTQTNHCHLAGVVSGTESKRSKWAAKYGLPGSSIYSYENFDSIVENPDIDIVYVALPNSMHADYVVRAARAGKHVICEKPLAITLEECDEIINACRNAGVMLSVGYRLHFDPFNLEMMRLAKEKVFGAVQRISASHGLSSATGWRLDKKLAGGGPLMDVGIYCVNAARYITGKEPIAVKADAGPKTDPVKFKDIEESLTWTMEYEGGIIADCSGSYSSYGNHLRVEAERGWFEIAPAFSYNGLRGKTSEGNMDIQPLNQQAAQLDDFALAILENRPTPVPGEMGRQDLKIMLAIYQSLESGQRVNIY